MSRLLDRDLKVLVEEPDSMESINSEKSLQSNDSEESYESEEETFL